MKKNNDGGDGDIGLYWMGPGAPTRPIYSNPYL